MIRRRLISSIVFWVLVIVVHPINGAEVTDLEKTVSGKNLPRLLPKILSIKHLIRSYRRSENPFLEGLFRPLEFREPIITMPVEVRYGIGYYGMDGFNIFGFSPKLIKYESSDTDRIEKIPLSGRTGQFMEVEGFQTNLSYLFFKKSYLDFLTGFGFRYSSILPIPNVTLPSGELVKGPPEVPSSWGVTKTFTPSVLEGNISTSLIFQWSPKWMLHLRYSYGLNRIRFYSDKGLNPLPYGTGTSVTYGVGVKYIRESETAARFAFGLELRHIYHKVKKIKDPSNVTPITGFNLPQFGIYFTFSAFYGGKPTIGDEGKKWFLKKDYISAKRLLGQFVEGYPRHGRIERAKKLLEICDEKIPFQLYGEGRKFEKRDKLDRALERYVQSSRTANDSLGKVLRWKMEEIAQLFIQISDSLFESGNDERALKFAQQAAVVSENGKLALRRLEARILMRNGKDLAIRGFFSGALEKYSEALSLVPHLKHDIRRLELEAAVGMLEDVNKANDEPSVRLALSSLLHAKEILGKKDKEMDKIISELERQLALLSEFRLKQKMEEFMEVARDEIAFRHMPKVSLGMLVAEVEYIMGSPQDVVERVNEKNLNYQMWIYETPDRKKAYFYFEDYVLFRIEEK